METMEGPNRHWLISFEGVRGLVYFVAIVSLVAPSILAFYLLWPGQFFKTPWPLSLLLAGSVGGATTLISLVDVVFGSDEAEAIFQRGEPNVRDETARRLLSGGPFLALIYQTSALLIALYRGIGFRDYVMIALVLSASISLANFLSRKLRSNFGKRKSRRASGD